MDAVSGDLRLVLSITPVSAPTGTVVTELAPPAEHVVLPRPRYNVVLFLGILYHLKKPFNALERLADYSDYSVLSTKVAALSGDRRNEIRTLPVAYVVAALETNNDPTNYWVFSEAGLHRILDRTGWTVRAWETFGDEESDPASNKHDQRVFCLFENQRHA